MPTAAKKNPSMSKAKGRQLASAGSRTAAAVRPARHTGASAFTGDPAEIIEGMRRGYPADVIAGIAERLDVSQERLFAVLRLPASTMKARLSRNLPLSAAEQDRMYRADRLWRRAVDVLEDEDAARSWINRPNRSLGGEAPLALLDTEAGYELVLDTLGRIENGVVS